MISIAKRQSATVQDFLAAVYRHGRSHFTPGVSAAAPTIGLSAAATAGLSAAAFAAYELLKHFVGQGRRAADAWVQSSSGQNAFLENVLKPADILGKEDPEAARQMVSSAWKNYLESANTYAAQGPNQAKVIQQNLTTPSFMGTLRNYLGGEDPLGDNYTQGFFGKAGSMLSSTGKAVGNAVETGLAAILRTLGKDGSAPTSGQTPGINPNAKIPTPQGSTADPQNTSTQIKNAAIKGGAALGSSLLGSALSGGSGGVPNVGNLLDESAKSIAQGRNIATSLEPRAKSLLGLSEESYGPVSRYYGDILSGNRGKVFASMQPDIARINEGYDANLNAVSNLLPRGGGRSAFFTEAPYRRTSDITSLLQTARPKAAEGLLNLGQTTGGQASNLFGNISGLLGGSQQGTGNLLNYNLQDRAAQYKKGQDIGATIYDVLKGTGVLGGK